MSDPSGKSGEILIRSPFKADVFEVLFDSVFSDIMPFFTQFPAVFPAGLNMIIYDEPCHLLSAGTCTDKCLFPIQFKSEPEKKRGYFVNRLMSIERTGKSHVITVTCIRDLSFSAPVPHIVDKRLHDQVGNAGRGGRSLRKSTVKTAQVCK